MTRLLTLLLLTRVTAEWVEISQHHYRKPLRTHSTFTTTEKSKDVEDSTKLWAYSNRTLTEYNWNKNPARPIIGNVKRIQHIANTVRATDVVKLEDEDADFDADEVDYEIKPNYGPTRATLDTHDRVKQKGMIETVSNVGNIKRVQLNSSPVKSPAVYFKGDREKYSITRHENYHMKGNEFEDKKITGPIKRKFNLNPQNAGRPGTSIEDEEEGTFVAEVNTFDTSSSQRYRNHTSTAKPTFITETEDFTTYESQLNRFQKITNSKSSEATENMNTLTTDIIETDENIVSKQNTKLTESTTETTFDYNVHRNVNDFETESFATKVHDAGNKGKQSNVKVQDQDIKANLKNVQLKDDLAKGEKKSEKIKHVTDKEGEPTNGTKKEKIKVNTMENLIKFMRVVADTISKNSRRSFGGKMQYLHELKDSILANIEQRIDSTWPDDDSANSRRRSRSAQASPRGHVQFPSSESALMTISFLTFAVFLIKLVLQVIQTYKQKAMMVAPLMVASGRQVFVNHGHH